MPIYEVTLIRDNVTPEVVLVEAASPKIAKRKAQHYLSPNSTAVWVPISIKRQPNETPLT